MARRESIQRINYIVDFLRKKPASFEEILVHLQTKENGDDANYSISQKTFKRDMDLILDIEAPLPNAPSMTGALELFIKKANNL
jgi:uroporphyrinogen-III synthase